MKTITNADLARVDVLVAELVTLNDLIDTSTDSESAERLRQERAELIAEINRVYGTDELLNGEKLSVINQTDI